ncbi:CoA transferase [Candidatus Mycobacterium wuenschmannii]|uniref:CoA transferase n=1 Tax=Candidatus Mycobacterium wuenschmannii TaxID=3027808 RepID=A0ABY8VT02_9MYCO|nr:CoA transferase [Candidatus Mycobacterium wuenschmannii]
MSALTGFRVVELAESVAGEYCGKLLADFGAEVIKVERPGGSPTRAMAPIVGEGGPECSAVFAYLNTNKRSVVIDGDGMNALIASADAVIGEQSVAEIAGDHPDTVFCAVTPYGVQAPAELHNAASLNVFHASGWGFHTPAMPIQPNRR